MPVDVLDPSVQAVGDVQPLLVVSTRAKDAVGHKRAVAARLDASFGDAVLVDDEDAGEGGMGDEEVLGKGEMSCQRSGEEGAR